MSEIVTPGRVPEKKYRTICRACATVFDVTKEDLIGLTYDPQEREMVAQVKCPLRGCGNKQWIAPPSSITS